MKAWLKAEIETQMWYYDPKNHAETLKIAAKYVTGFTEQGALVLARRAHPGALLRRTDPRRKAVRVE